MTRGAPRSIVVMTTHRLSRAIALGVMLALAMPGGALAAAPDAQDDSATVAEDDAGDRDQRPLATTATTTATP